MGDATSTSCNWVQGIGLSVLASVIGAASKLAIRKSFLMEESLLLKTSSDHCSTSKCTIQTSRDLKSATTAKWLRRSGMVGMGFLNPFCGVLAMNYASPSLVAPFSGLDLVWVILFSKAFVDEDPTFPQILAAMQVVFGEALIAMFGDHTNSNINYSDSDAVTSSSSSTSALAVLHGILSSYRDPVFFTYMIGFALWMVLVVYWMYFSHYPMLQRFAFGVAGGSVSGLQNFVKDWLTLSQAMMTTGFDSSQRNYWSARNQNPLSQIMVVFIILAVLSMITAIASLLLLTECMQRYNATFSSAMFVGSFVLNSSVMSAVHYRTFEHLSSRKSFVLYPMGLLMLLIGVSGILMSTSADELIDTQIVESGLESKDLNNPKVSTEDEDIDHRVCSRLFRFLGLSRLVRRMRGFHFSLESTSSDEALNPKQCLNSSYGTCV